MPVHEQVVAAPPDFIESTRPATTATGLDIIYLSTLGQAHRTKPVMNHLTAILLATLLTCQAPDVKSPPPLVGLFAPDFRLSGTDGQTHRLSTMLKNGPVVVVWFPKAYTANVEQMLKSFGPVAEELQARGVTVVAATCDKIKYLRAFVRETDIHFPILSDPTRTTAISWTAVHSGREIPERWAFFVGTDGKIAAVETDLEAARAGGLIRQRAERLGWVKPATDAAR